MAGNLAFTEGLLSFNVLFCGPRILRNERSTSCGEGWMSTVWKWTLLLGITCTRPWE